MNRVYSTLFLLAVLCVPLSNASAYQKGREVYEPVIIPNKMDPFEESRRKEKQEPQTFYTALDFGYLFSSPSDISIIATDFTNAGIQGLGNVGGFFNIRFEFGYENLFSHFDVFGTIGYLFSPGRGGTGDINYGLNPVNSTVGFGMYAVPFLVGAKYSVYNNEWIRVGPKVDLGINLIRGNIDLKINSSASQPIQNSSLSYGGTGFSGDILIFTEAKLSRVVNIEFDLGYSLTRLSSTKINGSSGNFATEFEPGKQLMIFDSKTGKSTPLTVNLSGFEFLLSAKVLF